MLPWIQVYSNLPEHPKIYALVDRLKLRRNSEAVGIVVSLWLWAAKNAPDGDLSGFPDRAIAAALDYPPKSMDKIFTALEETGWLDRTNSGGYEIHDWVAHAPALIDMYRREKDRTKERVRKFREKRKDFFPDEIVSQQTCNVTCNVTQNVTSDECNAPREEDRREDNRREDNRTISLSSPPSWSKEKLSSLFSPRLTLSESAMDELLSLTDGMEEAVVRRALDIAQDNGKLVWGYVKGILKNWKSCGIRTLSQVEEREAKRKGRGGNPGAANVAAPTVGAAEVAESRRRMKEILRE